MLKRTVQYFWNARRQVGKYIAVGGSGVFLDMGTLALFQNIFGVNPTIAVAMNQILILAYNFTLNKYWSFRNKELSRKQIIRYLALAFANYVISVIVMHYFNEVRHINDKIVRLATIAVAASWNFVLYKQWVYRSQEPIVHGQ